MFAAWSPCAAACLLAVTLAATAGVPGEARTPGATQASLHRAVRAVATLVFVGVGVRVGVGVTVGVLVGTSITTGNAMGVPVVLGNGPIDSLDRDCTCGA